MAATFTLNFFRSGIQFGSWGSFQLPGLLNFGEFKVRFSTVIPPPPISCQFSVSFRFGVFLFGFFFLIHACISVKGSWYLAVIAKTNCSLLVMASESLQLWRQKHQYSNSCNAFFLYFFSACSVLSLIRNATSGQLWTWASSFWWALWEAFSEPPSTAWTRDLPSTACGMCIPSLNWSGIGALLGLCRDLWCVFSVPEQK